MFENIREDIARKMRGYGVRPEDQTFFRQRITPLLELGTWAVIVYRFGRCVYGIKIPVIRQVMIGIYLVINTICLMLTGIHIQRKSDIGPGLVVHNCSCIFVLATRIGHSCSVNQGVSVASVRGTGWPTIGNNVYLGAGCKVMGGVTIGDNVVVSANSLVITDVPSNCTVLGVPARVISRHPVSPYLKSPVTTT
ncbi:MAG: serine acetyltransferase [Verrucomicrobia bacterium]|nr:MAG: serine acetyltransferase [Verrucomicrobiota bacterium]PYL63051.1 MAG: serine acetyltransferase [Verrucomicrobiota bacterium]